MIQLFSLLIFEHKSVMYYRIKSGWLPTWTEPYVILIRALFLQSSYWIAVQETSSGAENEGWFLLSMMLKDELTRKCTFYLHKRCVRFFKYLRTEKTIIREGAETEFAGAVIWAEMLILKERRVSIQDLYFPLSFNNIFNFFSVNGWWISL